MGVDVGVEGRAEKDAPGKAREHEVFLHQACPRASTAAPDQPSMHMETGYPGFMQVSGPGVKLSEIPSHGFGCECEGI